MRRTPALAVLTAAALLLTPAAPASASTVSRVHTQLEHILATSRSNGMSVRVDLAGKVVYSHSPSRQVSPASTEKLVTAYTALRQLGPGYRFVTRLGSTTAASPQGAISGSLVLTAGGDPTLTAGTLVVLASKLYAQGIRKVTGGILLDVSKYSSRCSPYWKAEYVPSEVGQLSAFAVDGNRYAGGCAVDPSAGNLAKLKKALGRAGISVTGPLRVGRPARAPRPLASVSSATLAAIVHTMIKKSVAFSAEMLLLAIGAKHGDGSLAGGVRVLRAEAKALHVTLGAEIWDGSGLAYADQESANAEVTWLEAIHRSTPTLAAMLDADLPISCVDGTLAARLCSGAAGRVHAKTGTLDISHALAGYVIDAAGHRLTFSFLIGGPSAATANAARAAIDASVQVLAASRL